MATVTANSQLTLIELAKRTHNARLLTIAENLSEVNDFLTDAIWVEANDLTRNVTTQRITLPTGSARQLNAGVAAEISQTRQVEDDIMMLESYSKVDAELVRRAPDPKGFRMNEDMAFVQGMGQTAVGKCFYGNHNTSPEEIHGLANRYNSSSLSNVRLEGGDQSDTASIWMLKWSSTDGVYMFYPRGSKTAGVNARDLGEDTVLDSGGTNEYQAFRTHFKIHFGICVRDTRNVQRIANIETEYEAAAQNGFDPNSLVKAKAAMRGNMAGTHIYVNEIIKGSMDINALDKENVQYTMSQKHGEDITNFRGIPVRHVDQLLSTETAIS